jgi:hypothetical protein
MSVSTAVPFTIAPDAAERLAELDMQAELERMLEHTHQTVPGLRSVRVVIRPVYDTHEDTGITLEAIVDEVFDPESQTWWQWQDWFHATFPPPVWEHFEFHIAIETSHAG